MQPLRITCSSAQQRTAACPYRLVSDNIRKRLVWEAWHLVVPVWRTRAD